MTPSETTIAQVQSETGMDRMQAINHLRQRAELQRRMDASRLVRVDLPQDWQVPEPAAIEPKPRWRPSLRMIGAIAAIYALGLLAYALAPLF